MSASAKRLIATAAGAVIAFLVVIYLLFALISGGS